MKPKDISKARNPDLRASRKAIARAAALAREIALQTNTAIVVVKDGKLMRIPARRLRAGAA